MGFKPHPSCLPAVDRPKMNPVRDVSLNGMNITYFYHPSHKWRGFLTGQREEGLPQYLCNRLLINVIRDFWTFSEISSISPLADISL